MEQCSILVSRESQDYCKEQEGKAVGQRKCKDHPRLRRCQSSFALTAVTCLVLYFHGCRGAIGIGGVEDVHAGFCPEARTDRSSYDCQIDGRCIQEPIERRAEKPQCEAKVAEETRIAQEAADYQARGFRELEGFNESSDQIRRGQTCQEHGIPQARAREAAEERRCNGRPRGRDEAGYDLGGRVDGKGNANITIQQAAATTACRIGVEMPADARSKLCDATADARTASGSEGTGARDAGRTRAGTFDNDSVCQLPWSERPSQAFWQVAENHPTTISLWTPAHANHADRSKDIAQDDGSTGIGRARWECRRSEQGGAGEGHEGGAGHRDAGIACEKRGKNRSSLLRIKNVSQIDPIGDRKIELEYHFFLQHKGLCFFIAAMRILMLPEQQLQLPDLDWQFVFGVISVPFVAIALVTLQKFAWCRLFDTPLMRQLLIVAEVRHSRCCRRQRIIFRKVRRHLLMALLFLLLLCSQSWITFQKILWEELFDIVQHVSREYQSFDGLNDVESVKSLGLHSCVDGLECRNPQALEGSWIPTDACQPPNWCAEVFFDDLIAPQILDGSSMMYKKEVIGVTLNTSSSQRKPWWTPPLLEWLQFIEGYNDFGLCAKGEVSPLLDLLPFDRGGNKVFQFGNFVDRCPIPEVIGFLVYGTGWWQSALKPEVYHCQNEPMLSTANWKTSQHLKLGEQISDDLQNEDDDIHMLMQQGLQYSMPRSSLQNCQMHPDMRVARDLVEIRNLLGPIQTGAIAWTVPAVINHFHQQPTYFDLNTLQCPRCTLEMRPDIPMWLGAVGPYWVRPQPPLPYIIGTQQFLLLERPKTENFFALLVHHTRNDDTQRGTVVVAHANSYVNMVELFQIVNPGHRCWTRAWCRVRQMNLETWWPDMVRADDFEFLQLDEIDPPTPSNVSVSTRDTTAPSVHDGSVAGQSTDIMSMELVSQCGQTESDVFGSGIEIGENATPSQNDEDPEDERDDNSLVQQLQASAISLRHHIYWDVSDIAIGEVQTTNSIERPERNDLGFKKIHPRPRSWRYALDPDHYVFYNEIPSPEVVPCLVAIEILDVQIFGATWCYWNTGQYIQTRIYDALQPAVECSQDMLCMIQFHNDDYNWPGNIEADSGAFLVLVARLREDRSPSSASTVLGECVSSSMSDYEESTLLTLPILFLVRTTAAAFIGDDIVANDIVQEIAAHQEILQNQDLIEQTPLEVVDYFDWHNIFLRTGLNRPTTGEVVRTYRPRMNADVKSTHTLWMTSDQMTSTDMILNLETHWRDIGPYPHHFNEWSLQQLHSSIDKACSQGRTDYNYVLLAERDGTLQQQHLSAFVIEVQWLRWFGTRECFLFPTAKNAVMTGRQLIAHAQLSRPCTVNFCRVFKNDLHWPLDNEQNVDHGAFVIVTVHEIKRETRMPSQHNLRERSRSRDRISEGIDVQLHPSTCFSPRQSLPGQRQITIHLPSDTSIMTVRNAVRLTWQSLGDDDTWSPVEVHPSCRDSLLLREFAKVFVLWDYIRCSAESGRSVILIETIFTGVPMSSAGDVNAFAVSTPMYGFELLMITQLHSLCTGPVNYKCELWHNSFQITADQQTNVRHGDFCRIIVLKSDQLASYAIVYSATISRRDFSHADFLFGSPQLRNAWESLISNAERPLPWIDPTEGLRPPGNGAQERLIFCNQDLNSLDDNVTLGDLHYIFDYVPPRVRISLSELVTSSVEISSSVQADRVSQTLLAPAQQFELPITPEQLSSFVYAWSGQELLSNIESMSEHLHTSTVKALETVTIETLDFETVSKLIFYVDGSYCPTTSAASWAFVVGGFHKCKPDFTIFGWQHGHVQLDEEQSDWLGASHASSFVAEQTAILQAVWFALRLPLHVEVEFGYDNLAAAKMTSGEWQLNQENVISKLARAAFQLLVLRLEGQPRCFHIKAHTNHPWNDMADALAKIALQERASGVNLDFDVRPWLHGFQPLIEHLPFYWKLFSDNQAYPQCHDTTVSWLRWTNSDFQRPDFVKNQLPEAARTTIDNISLTIATYNVCTLTDSGNSYDEPWKAEYLRAQLSAKEVAVIALQETRANKSIFLSTPNFFRFISQSDRGQGGVELWFSNDIPFAPKRYFLKEMFQVVFDSPRMLAVIVDLPDASLLFLSCHAPHANRPESERVSWWNKFERCLKNFARNRHVFCLGDFNATFGDSVPNCIGEILDTSTNVNGQHFLKQCEQNNIWMPTTFEGIHSGPSGTWFCARNQQWTRRDYIAISDSMKVLQIATWLDRTLHAAQIHLDHCAVCMYVQFEANEKTNKKRKKKGISRQAIRDPNNRDEILQIFRELPTIPWDIDVHCHYDQLVTNLQKQLAEKFPEGAIQKRKSYISDATWMLWKYRLSLRKQIDDIFRQRRKHLLRLCWNFWTSGILIPMDELPFVTLCQFQFFYCTVQKHIRKQLKKDRSVHFETLSKNVDKAPAYEIYQQLRALGLGSGMKKKGLSALPMLSHPDGMPASSFQEAQGIWMNFAKSLEFGELDDHHSIWRRCVRQYLRQNDQPSNMQWNFVPSHQRIEHFARKVKYNKATGPDGLVAEIFHLFPGPVAENVHQLLVKMVCHIAEPVSAKGGLLVRAFKGKGSPKDPSAYRGLLISNHLAKILHAAIREPLLPFYSANALPMQLGGRKHATVGTAGHLARLFLSWCRQSSVTAGILFLDIQTAFYRVLRPLICRYAHFHEQLRNIIQYFELGPELYQEVCESLNEPSAMMECDVPQHLEALCSELHASTWFSTANREELVRTCGGTRPGSPCADLIFNMLFQKVLRKLRSSLYAQGLLCDFDWSGEKSLYPGSRSPELSETLFDIVWADDFAVLFVSPDGTSAPRRAAVIAGELFDFCMKYGLKPNFERGKTELLLAVRGKGSVKVRRQLFEHPDPHLEVDCKHIPDCKIRLITQYRHLGGSWSLQQKTNRRCSLVLAKRELFTINIETNYSSHRMSNLKCVYS